MASKTLQGKYAEKLETENKQLREELYTTRKFILEEQQQRINKAIEYIKKNIIFDTEQPHYKSIIIPIELLEILGEKE